MLQGGVFKDSPGRGMKLFLQEGGRVGENTKNATYFLKETKKTTKKVAVLAAWKKNKKIFVKNY